MNKQPLTYEQSQTDLRFALPCRRYSGALVANSILRSAPLTFGFVHAVIRRLLQVSDLRSHAVTLIGRATFGPVIVGTLLTSCATPHSQKATAQYLTSPSSVQLGRPICITIQDMRPSVERDGLETSPYLYTTDGPDRGRVALVFGSGMRKLMERRRMTDRAQLVVPGEALPADCVVIHVALLSWYGRLPRDLDSTVTEQVVELVFSRPEYAQGGCRFSATLEYAAKTTNLGYSEGSSLFQVSRKATISKEGNWASAGAVDQAMAQFLRSFEKHFSR